MFLLTSTVPEKVSPDVLKKKISPEVPKKRTLGGGKNKYDLTKPKN